MNPASRFSVSARRFAASGLLLASMGVTAAARAQDYPNIDPRRPAAVTYDLSSTATGPLQVSAFADPALQVLRLQLGGGGDYLLLDRATERVMLVSPGKHLVFAVSSAGMLHRRLGPDSGLRFRREGQRMVAGEDCTLWHVRGPGGSGEACVTDDGIVLEGAGHGNRPDSHGEIPSGRLIATRVSYGPLPPSLFAPPPGLPEIDLPPSLFRAMLPALGGFGQQ